MDETKEPGWKYVTLCLLALCVMAGMGIMFLYGVAAIDQPRGMTREHIYGVTIK